MRNNIRELPGLLSAQIQFLTATSFKVASVFILSECNSGFAQSTLKCATQTVKWNWTKMIGDHYISHSFLKLRSFRRIQTARKSTRFDRQYPSYFLCITLPWLKRRCWHVNDAGDMWICTIELICQTPESCRSTERAIFL